MKNKIVELIEKYGKFTTETGSDDLKEFSVWLNRSFESNPPLYAKISLSQTERDIAYLINRLSKFSRFYTRKVLVRYGMTSIDEFYFLISMAKLKNPSKNDVYKDTITELTTGAQIMRRLIKNGLVKEMRDKVDKRMKRVSLTEKGRKMKEKIFEDFTETVKLKTGNLSQKEKKTLRGLLLNLHDFHTVMYDTDADKPVKYLIEKYVLK